MCTMTMDVMDIDVCHEMAKDFNCAAIRAVDIKQCYEVTFVGSFADLNAFRHHFNPMGGLKQYADRLDELDTIAPISIIEQPEVETL